MNQYRYAIRHIEPLSAFKFGLVVGGMVMLLPGFGLGVTMQSLIDLLWDIAHSTLFAPDLGPLEQLHQMGWGLVWLMMLGSVIFGAFSGGLSAVLSALLYNLVTGVSGGIVVHADLLNAAPLPAVPAAAAPVPALPPPVYTPAPALASSPSATSAQPPVPQPNAAHRNGVPALIAAEIGGQVWSLHGAVTIVGSASACDIQLDGLAAIHAEIRLQNNRYVLYDMSGGQTWVNDRQITTANLLKDGFRVRLGAREFVFGAPSAA